MLLYELLLGLVPWDGNNPDQIMDQIKAADVVWPPEGMVSTGRYCCCCCCCALIPAKLGKSIGCLLPVLREGGRVCIGVVFGVIYSRPGCLAV